MKPLREDQLWDIIEAIEPNSRQVQQRGLAGYNPIKALEFTLQHDLTYMTRWHFKCREHGKCSFIIVYKRDGQFTHAKIEGGWANRSRAAVVDIQHNLEIGNKPAFILGPMTVDDAHEALEVYTDIVEHWAQIKKYFSNNEKGLSKSVI